MAAEGGGSLLGGLELMADLGVVYETGDGLDIKEDCKGPGGGFEGVDEGWSGVSVELLVVCT